MLFNSIEFLLFFLPITVFAYYALLRANSPKAANAFLLVASLVFYSWWDIRYLPLILGSIVFNFLISKKILVSPRAKVFLGVGIALNLLSLAYFKYADFILSNVNFVAGTRFPELDIVLPLAISFFTFQQMSYLVDVYRERNIRYDFVEYALFVTFFTQLIAGPIVHHAEIMPQLLSKKDSRVNWQSVTQGMYILAVGLFKKVILADNFARWVSQGYGQIDALTGVDAWIATLSYTLQIYFDFSGYCDMALGASLFFNIRLPQNFNSPYQSLNIQQFWRNWHMTLGRWFRDYVYIPLGGNKVSKALVLRNLFLTAFVSGIWHGAGWTFVLWGTLHGTAMASHKVWSDSGRKMPKWLAWPLTLMFVHLSWVVFRAKDMTQALAMYKKMFTGLDLSISVYGKETIPALFAGFVIVLFFQNGVRLLGVLQEQRQERLLSFRWALVASIMIFVSVLSTIAVSYTEFIYFNF